MAEVLEVPLIASQQKGGDRHTTVGCGYDAAYDDDGERNERNNDDDDDNSTAALPTM